MRFVADAGGAVACGHERLRPGSAPAPSLRCRLINRLVQLDNLAKDKTKIEGVLSSESRDMIRMRNQMRFELSAVEGELKDLCKAAAADDKEGGKVTREEIAARKEVIETVKDEYYKVFEEITGAKHAGDKSLEQGGAGMSVLSKEALISGTFAGAGMKMDREALSGEHQQQMAQIRMEVQEQDEILEEISKGLDDLKDAADKIGDELQAQETMLADLERKTDKTQAKLDDVNEKSKEALAKLNDKSTNFCIYIICFVILVRAGRRPTDAARGACAQSQPLPSTLHRRTSPSFIFQGAIAVLVYQMVKAKQK